jgi:transcriptional regulator GlxA family with amidase domain
VHPHSLSHELSRRAASSDPRVVRLAIDAIDDHPMMFVTVADIARVAQVSVRSLEDAFRRSRNMTPMEYLRLVRLRRVYEALRDAEAGTTTASSIAADWGFHHYGRFVQHFRGQFGQTPAEILNHRRVRSL